MQYTAEFLLPAVFLFAIVVEEPILLTCVANKLFLPQYAGRQLFVSKAGVVAAGGFQDEPFATITAVSCCSFFNRRYSPRWRFGTDGKTCTSVG